MTLSKLVSLPESKFQEDLLEEIELYYFSDSIYSNTLLAKKFLEASSNFSNIIFMRIIKIYLSLICRYISLYLSISVSIYLSRYKYNKILNAWYCPQMSTISYRFYDHLLSGLCF